MNWLPIIICVIFRSRIYTVRTICQITNTDLKTELKKSVNEVKDIFKSRKDELINKAKEASDITIIDNSFSSIGKAVMWGRSL